MYIIKIGEDNPISKAYQIISMNRFNGHGKFG